MFILFLFIHFQILFPAGGDNVRPYWDKYYEGTEGVVFVFNSACSEEELQKLSSLLHSTLSHSALQSRPVLLLASYQDQEGARTVEQVGFYGWLANSVKCAEVTQNLKVRGQNALQVTCVCLFNHHANDLHCVRIKILQN